MAALFSAISLHAQSKWIRMQTPDFEVFSQASEADTRKTLQYFERVRSFFLLFTGHAPLNPLPVQIVIFKSAKEYEPYKAREFAIAYYAGGTDRDYIVMGKTGEQTAQAATHEYVHLVARHAGLNWPPWLNEGMAELYGTLHSLGGDDLEFGSAIPGRVLALRQEKWVPLATILTADQESPYYNESSKAGNLYNEGWALVQFLATSKEYRPGFADVTEAVHAGKPSIEVLETVYKRPLAKIEEDLKFYLSSGSFMRLVTKLKLDPVREKAVAEPANMFDVRLALANLPGPSGKAEQKVRLEELSREDPKRPEPWAGLAYLAWRDQDQKQAVELFAKAYELGDHNPKLLWAFGRLAERDRPEDALRALEELVKLEPGNVDARIEVAAVQMNARQPAQALATLKPITNVTPQQAQRLFDIIASAQIQTGDRAGARATATRLASEAKDQRFKDRAAEMLRYLDQADSRQNVVPAPQRAQTAPELQGAAPEQRPGLVARAPTPASPPPQPTVPAAERPSVQGRIVAMNCNETPTLIVETDQGNRTFALEPNKTVVLGAETGALNLRCGRLPTPMPVRIFYDPAPAGVAVAGVVREMHF